MARIQILELPAGPGDERPPFALVIDQCQPQRYMLDPDHVDQFVGPFDGVAEQIGARAVLVFAETIDIPDNGSTPTGYSELLTLDAAPAETVDTALAVLVLDTLGLDLTEGQPVPAFALDNACRQLAKSEAARKHMRAERTAMRARLREALGLDNDEGIDVLAAARDMAQELGQKREAIRSIIHLHRGESHEGQAICVECSAYDGWTTTGNEPVGYPCDTVRRIWEANGEAGAVEASESAGDALVEARMWARAGYEIGQRHCGWSDHGVAPAWLTEGWPSFDSCEHSARAAEYDTKLALVQGLVADIEADVGQLAETEAGNLRRIAGMLRGIVGDAYVVTEKDS